MPHSSAPDVASHDPTTVEVFQIGKVCHTRCAIYYLAGDCIFSREGIFGWLVEPGVVRVGGEVRVLELGAN